MSNALHPVSGEGDRANRVGGVTCFVIVTIGSIAIGLLAHNFLKDKFAISAVSVVAGVEFSLVAALGLYLLSDRAKEGVVRGVHRHFPDLPPSPKRLPDGAKRAVLVGGAVPTFFESGFGDRLDPMWESPQDMKEIYLAYAAGHGVDGVDTMLRDAKELFLVSDGLFGDLLKRGRHRRGEKVGAHYWQVCRAMILGYMEPLGHVEEQRLTLEGFELLGSKLGQTAQDSAEEGALRLFIAVELCPLIYRS